MNKYDLIVLGAGSGGLRAARLAAQQGLKTLVIEKRHWGGTCVNLGCVPKKLLVYASDYARALQHSKDYSFQAADHPDHNEVLLNWQDLSKRILAETNRLQGVYQKLLKDNKVDMLSGTARLSSPTSLAIDAGDEEFTADKILIATGSRPRIPDIPGSDLGITSDDMFSLPQLPQSISIVGAGYIGLEFACIMAAFGVQVNLFNRSAIFLRGFDNDVSSFAIEQISQNPNITIHTNTSVKYLQRNSSGGIDIAIQQDGKDVQLTSEQILFAAGRIPNSDAIGIEDFAITDKSGAIEVDDFYQTSTPNIYALGDVVGKRALTPVAIAEAKKFIAKHIINEGENEVSPLDYQAIPMAVFSRPEIAMLGLSEEQATETCKVKTYKAKFNPLSEALREDKQPFLIKLICDASDHRVLGVHLSGSGAAEMIQGFVPLYMKKFNKNDLDMAVGVHPTSMEEIFTLS